MNTLIIILLAVDFIMMAAVMYILVKYKSLYRAFDYFMRGRDAESLEDTIRILGEDVENLKSEDRANKEAIRVLNRLQRASFQKSGIVHYNAFQGMGGNLSFAWAILDYTNSGYILNSVHSREGCYVYIKTVDCGKTEVLLGAEEQAALEQALGYIEKE